MTTPMDQLIADATAAGYRVRTNDAGDEMSITKRVARKLVGLKVAEYGSAWDVSLPLAEAREIRSIAAMRAVLGI